jgi:hypothetical protein
VDDGVTACLGREVQHHVADVARRDVERRLDREVTTLEHDLVGAGGELERAEHGTDLRARRHPALVDPDADVRIGHGLDERDHRGSRGGSLGPGRREAETQAEHEHRRHQENKSSHVVHPRKAPPDGDSTSLCAPARHGLNPDLR